MKLRQLLVPLAAAVTLGAASVTASAAPPQTLRLADMPAGWTQVPHTPGKNACRFVERPDRRVVEFNGSGEDSLTSAVLTFPTVAGARKALTVSLARGRTCRMAASGMSAANFRLAQMSFPRVGAQSFGLKIFITVSGKEMPVGGIVFVRSGQRVAYLSYASIFPDLDQLQVFARTALRRLG